MKPFLLELAENLHRQYGKKLETVTLVFPNRRAILYFRKHLSTLLVKPAFAPALLTIEDFISGFSTTLVPDKLELIHRLYNVYHAVLHGDHENDPVQAESFDQFYFWGEMLLRDFDEADKYLVQTEHLFKDLSNQKELDAGFDFLSPEQLEFLRSFWSSFEEKDSANKSRFLYIWRQLQRMYIAFGESLRKERLAYEGMLHREVAEDIDRLYKRGNTKSHPIVLIKDGPPELVFAGFNALTRAEEKIMSWFVSQNLATIFWDVDSFYMNHSIQEAGKFFREYQQHPVLGKTFPPDIPSNFKKLKGINLYGASQPVGQAKLMAHLLTDKLKSGFKPEETLIVLPDEKLVMPVLHGVSAEVEKLNVTMGFPLTSTPLFNLVELIVEMQINFRDDAFNHQQVIAILGHPYVVAADAGEAQAKRKFILKQNWVMVPANYLSSAVTLHREMFRKFRNNAQAGLTDSIIGYLRSLIIEIGRLKNLQALDREFCFHFLKLLNQLERVIIPSQEVKDRVESIVEDGKRLRKEERLALKSFLRLFRQLVRLEKIPFRGEPLQGLQVMGVLETRNLDFKNVFILSLNEGSFPSFNSKGSYIPFNIRKAYGLPIPEHQDSIYAYLFYRILQRAENVYLFHNTETDDLGQGELSRYVQQLIFESGIPIKRHVLHNELRPLEITPITVVKDESVYAGLAQYCSGAVFRRALSPSALNDYLECRLRFYFRYIAKVREAREIEEDLDARVLGNFVHRVMEFFYLRITEEKKSKLIERKDFDHYSDIEPLIDKAFIKSYSLDPDKNVVYEGQRLVVKEVVRRFVNRIIEIDKEYAPFTIEALERSDINFSVKVHAEGNPVVLLGGSIDRADRKDNVIRVVDYKTGKDDLTFNDVASLFARDTKRNKAAFQTLLYTFLYKKAEPHAGLKFVPGLLNRLNLFKDDFKFGLIHDGDYLNDATPLLPEFESSVVALLNELYSPDVPFDQTTYIKNCEFCSYQRICYR